MKIPYFLVIALLVIAVAAGPASAFTSQTLVVDVDNNGDADITFDYQLSWPEMFAYYLIPFKEEMVKTAIAGTFKKVTVTGIQVSVERTNLTLETFASVSKSATATTYRTPAVSFLIAKDMLTSYPEIAQVLSPDFSPDLTIVRFPGGREYSYKGVTGIPALTATTTV